MKNVLTYLLLTMLFPPILTTIFFMKNGCYSFIFNSYIELNCRYGVSYFTYILELFIFVFINVFLILKGKVDYRHLIGPNLIRFLIVCFSLLLLVYFFYEFVFWRSNYSSNIHSNYRINYIIQGLMYIISFSIVMAIFSLINRKSVK